jgi:hypothetical protein
LAIPHLIFAGLWGYAANILALLQWFVILFTGKRNQGMWGFQRGYLAYYSRVTSYVALLFDEPYPNFGSAWGGEPVAFDLRYEEQANRLTNALRFIWIIPALIILFFLGIAAAFVLLASWVVIVITGKHPRGMWDFILRVYRFSFNVDAYALLMTDQYPSYDGGEPTGMLPPGDRSAAADYYRIAPPPGSGAPLPPPSGPPVG